ncbi:MAG: branched-chain amino acid ABC transporter permease [Alphaproteobacteria bacterium]
MDWTLLFEQLLNGLQLGILLFLLAAGLTVVFGVMDLMNLAHGSLYMIGAFVAATVAIATGSFLLAMGAAIVAALIIGIIIEVTLLRSLYGRGHLDQVLATFGLILFFNELVRVVWGPEGLEMPLPAFFDTAVTIFGFSYPVYRLGVIGVGLVTAAFLFLVVSHTRIGMLIRAGASDRTMVGALGVDIKLLFTLVFGLGAALAGLAGVMAAPILSVAIGMGEEILILAFVVIVIGGIGSIQGAFVAAIVIGVIDTLGRSFLDDLFKLFLPANAAETAAPAVASMLIYILMAAVLFFRPQGLFPART